MFIQSHHAFYKYLENRHWKTRLLGCLQGISVTSLQRKLLVVCPAGLEQVRLGQSCLPLWETTVQKGPGVFREHLASYVEHWPKGSTKSFL